MARLHAATSHEPQPKVWGSLPPAQNLGSLPLPKIWGSLPPAQNLGVATPAQNLGVATPSQNLGSRRPNPPGLTLVWRSEWWTTIPKTRDNKTKTKNKDINKEKTKENEKRKYLKAKNYPIKKNALEQPRRTSLYLLQFQFFSQYISTN